MPPLLELLERRIAEEQEPERKSELRHLQSTLSDVGKNVAGGLLVEYLKYGIA